VKHKTRIYGGSSFLFFVALTLPLTLFSLTLAADFAGIMMENRKAITVADAAARAAATAIDPESGRFKMSPNGKAADVNCTETTGGCTALDMAQKLYNVNIASGSLTTPDKVCGPQVQVQTDPESRQLTVFVSYAIQNLSFLGTLYGESYSDFRCLTAVATVTLCGYATGEVNCLYPGAY